MPSGLTRGWTPVRVKKTRQIKNLELRFDSIETEKALDASEPVRSLAVARGHLVSLGVTWGFRFGMLVLCTGGGRSAPASEKPVKMDMKKK